MLDKYSIVCSPRIVEVPPTRRGAAAGRPPTSIRVPTTTSNLLSHNSHTNNNKVSIHTLRNESRSLVDKSHEKNDIAKGQAARASEDNDDTTSLSECSTLEDSVGDVDEEDCSQSSSEGTGSGDDVDKDDEDNDDADSLSEYLNQLLMNLWTAHMENDEARIAQAFQQLALECGPQRGWPQTRRRVLYAGGHSQILHILSEHRTSNAICRSALGAVMALCVSYSARALVGTSASGIETIVAVMREHSHDAFLQTTACAILVQLVSPPSSERDRYTQTSSSSSRRGRRNDDAAATTSDRQAVAAAELSKSAVVAAGGIPVVLDAMKKQATKSPRLCRYACLLLVRMATNEYHRERLLSEGALPVVSGLVRAYRSAECEAYQQANALLRILQSIDASKGGNRRAAYGADSTYFYEI